MTIITVEAENSTEQYALRHWNDQFFCYCDCKVVKYGESRLSIHVYKTLDQIREAHNKKGNLTIARTGKVSAE